MLKGIHNILTCIGCDWYYMSMWSDKVATRWSDRTYQRRWHFCCASLHCCRCTFCCLLMLHRPTWLVHRQYAKLTGWVVYQCEYECCKIALITNWYMHCTSNKETTAYNTRVTLLECGVFVGLCYLLLLLLVWHAPLGLCSANCRQSGRIYCLIQVEC